jgi:hypothetical protein
MIVLAIVVLAGIAGLYAVAIKRVWQDTSEYDPSDPPTWWPFSLPLWRGVSRAFPVQGACAILVIGGGIGADLAGKDSSGYDIGMSVGLVGLLGFFLLALPITFFNRPRFLVPPHQRDDPGVLAEWRRARHAGR